VPAELPDLLEGLERTWASIAEVCAGLRDDEWALPTGCPGWTVADNIAHITGLELELAGEPVPEVELPDLPRLRDQPMNQHMERAVQARRGMSPAELLDEYRRVIAMRIPALAAEVGAGDPDRATAMPMGSTAPLGRALRIRLFDCWDHEQDIRRATGRRGHLEGMAAEHSRDMIFWRVGTRLTADAGMGDGQSAVITVTGPSARTVTFVVEEGKARQSDGRSATAEARIEADFESFIARGCGRRDASGALLGSVRIDGDRELGARIVEVLPSTP
jgi:uncharacterized protein (TIGR03083 family)